MAVIILSTVDLTIVCRDNVIVDEDQSGARVSDRIDAAGLELAISNTITGASKLPESLAIVHGCVGDVASIFAAINEAKVVRARSALLQVGSEDICFKNTFFNGRVEESGLLLRLDCFKLITTTRQLPVVLTCVDRAESQTQQAIVVLVLLELRTNCLRQFNSLARNGSASDIDSIGVNIATGARAIAVADVPSGPRKFLRRGRFGWIINTVTTALRA